MQQWANLRDTRGRHLVEVGQAADLRSLKEVEREMETIQERFNRLMDERHTAGRTEGLAAGQVEGVDRGIRTKMP